MNSAKNAWYQGIASPYDATPSPMSLAAVPSTPTMVKAPATAPATCAATYDGHLGPRELAGGGQPERDRRVDVVAADVAEDVDRDDHDRGERQRDDAEVRAAERRAVGLVDQEQGRDRADAHEDQERGAEELCGELLPPRVFIHASDLPCDAKHIRQCRIMIRKCGAGQEVRENRRARSMLRVRRAGA